MKQGKIITENIKKVNIEMFHFYVKHVIKHSMFPKNFT